MTSDGRTVGPPDGRKSLQVLMMASATSPKLTARPRTAARVVPPLNDEGCVASSRIDPCCRKASPRRTCADPTSFRSRWRISPPTEDAKHDVGRSDGRTVRRSPASTASTPRNRSAAAIRVWIWQYALRKEPKWAIGAATAYVTSCSCHTAFPPVGRRTTGISWTVTVWLRPIESVGGFQQYNRSDALPARMASSSSATSAAMFSMPECP